MAALCSSTWRMRCTPQAQHILSDQAPFAPSPVGVVDVFVALQQVMVVYMVVLSHLQKAR